jgi:hypothetical protein
MMHYNIAVYQVLVVVAIIIMSVDGVIRQHVLGLQALIHTHTQGKFCSRRDHKGLQGSRGVAVFFL